MVEDLELHSVVSSVLAHGCTDTYTVVGTGSELELETEDEVAVLVLCIEVTETVAALADSDCTVLCSIVCLVALPLVE